MRTRLRSGFLSQLLGADFIGQHLMLNFPVERTNTLLDLLVPRCGLRPKRDPCLLYEGHEGPCPGRAVAERMIEIHDEVEELRHG